MEYKDYYKIMGLKRDATPEEIKRAYRKLARKYHPDVSKEADAERRFKDIGEANEVLRDPVKRAAYDRLDPNMTMGREFRPPPNWDSGFEFHSSGFSDISGFSDFFEALFGKHYSRADYHARGQDFHVKVLIDLEDTFHGAIRSFTLQSPEVDEHGRLQQRTLQVKIPQGIKDGQQLRLKEQGGRGIGEHQNGDLFLEVHFHAHPYFRAEGRDLFMQLPVTPWEAALGGLVKAPTPAGVVSVKIPPGSNSGLQLRLKGRGIPGQPAGDIYVTLSVVTPPANSEQSKALYKEMEKTLPFNPRSHLGV